MASTGTATGPQEADGTVHQPEAVAGVDSQQSGAQFRQEGASLSETGQAAKLLCIQTQIHSGLNKPVT